MKDYLTLHLQELPYFRALLRAVEARFYQDMTLPSPVLDLGCGDGHFASLAFEEPLDMGLDPWWGQILEAASRCSYRTLVCAEGNNMPYPSAYFSSAVSNSVLEHIPDLDPVILELARVLKPGAPFIFCVPNHQFLSTLSLGQFFDKLKLPGFANAYRRFFTGFPATIIVICWKYGGIGWKKPDLKSKNGGIIFRQKRFILWNGDTFSEFHPG